MYIPRSHQSIVELEKVERRGNWTKCALLIFKTPLNLRKAVVRIICLELFFFAFKITSSQETQKNRTPLIGLHRIFGLEFR